MVSLSLTAVRRLVHRIGLKWRTIGMIQMASESILDRSKSMKSEMMQLIEEDDRLCFDKEGVDVRGSNMAEIEGIKLCIDWLNGPSWDGRLAMAVVAEAAPAHPSLGECSSACAIAVLFGQVAPFTCRALQPAARSHLQPGCPCSLTRRSSIGHRLRWQ